VCAGLVLGLAALLGAGDAARAAGGVLEINQTCAAGPGCFAGDAPGFPVQIDGFAGRSFRLSGDLVVASADTTAILVSRTVSGIAIDLGGFAIRGPVTCSGSPLVCSASGAGDGVARELGATASAIVVRNGTIVGMGDTGVYLPLTDGSVVEDLLVRENAGDGVVVGDAARIHRVSALQNGEDGVVVIGGGSLVTRSAARENGLGGFSGGGAGAVLFRNQATGNGTRGIAHSGPINLVGSVVRQSGELGVNPGTGSLLLGNTIAANGQTIASDGAFVAPGGRLHGNALRANLALGASLSLDASYSENVFTANGTGAVLAGSGANRGENLCAGNGVGSPTCP
jgi:hypothetical protein